MTPRIEMAKYPGSAAESFLQSFSCDDHDWTWEWKGEEEADGCTPYRLADLCTKWATAFSIDYRDGAVIYDFEGGERKAKLKIPMAWGDWCGMFYTPYFDADCPLLYATYVPPFTYPKAEELPDTVDFEGGELVFRNYDGGEIFKKTPEEFMADISKATEERWDLDFPHWIFITQGKDGAIRKVGSLEELRSLLGDRQAYVHRIQAHVRRIREGKNEPASMQIEVKIGDGLYGVADYQPENLTFLATCLGFKGIPSLHYAGFDLPLPIINCIIY